MNEHEEGKKATDKLWKELAQALTEDGVTVMGLLTQKAYRTLITFKKLNELALKTQYGKSPSWCQEDELYLIQLIENCRRFASAEMSLDTFMQELGMNVCAPDIDYHVNYCKCERIKN